MMIWAIWTTIDQKSMVNISYSFFYSHLRHKFLGSCEWTLDTTSQLGWRIASGHIMGSGHSVCILPELAGCVCGVRGLATTLVFDYLVKYMLLNILQVSLLFIYNYKFTLLF